MNNTIFLYIPLAIGACGICYCAFLLRRILNILRQMNYGEPSQEDLQNIEFSKFKLKE